jgi:hypothetical protein
MKYWFVAYHLTGGKYVRQLTDVSLSNVALAGIHPLDWLSQARERAPEAHGLGMLEHIIFYDEIDAELFDRIERANYIPTQRSTGG